MRSLTALVLTLGFAGAAPASTPELTSGRLAILGACPAVEDGYYDLGHNAAALTALTHMQFGYTHIVYPVNKTYGEIIGGAYNFADYGRLGAAFATNRVGDVEQYGPHGEPLGDYLYHDDRISLGYGYNVTPWLAIGSTVNYYLHHHSPATAYGAYGVDASLYGHPLLYAQPSWEASFGDVTAGITLRNIAASARRVYSGEYRDAAALTAGVAWGRDLGAHRLGVAASLPMSPPATPAVGTELVYAGTVSGTVGIVDKRPGLGLGVSTDLFTFTYAVSSRGLGYYHFASFSINPGRDVHASGARRRQIEKWLEEGRRFYETGDYDLAVERFSNVLQWEPHHKLAKQYWIRSKYASYVAQGNAATAAQDWERARRAYRSALVVEPEDFLATEYLANVDRLEQEEIARRAEEARVAALLDEAEQHKKRRSYKKAIAICEEVLRQHPDNARAAKLLADARRLWQLETKKPVEGPKPSEIPAEIAARYREASALLERGATGDAVKMLSEIVAAYPDYAAARTKLVNAYLYQGLDFYSQGSLTAALRVWKRALALDPQNEKIARYIKKAEAELDQIR